jgi:D-beta-D-heptose 7-phosphate kinase/D-beta-D-heptose 1-phosphate adenosyltransferase
VGKRVLVIGDSISDVYREFEYRKQCPDAPTVPVVVSVSDEVRPGGAANVAMNLSALLPDDYDVDLISVVDMDLLGSVRHAVGVSDCVVVTRSMSLRKERVIVDGKLQTRLDNKTAVDPDDSLMVSERVAGYLTEKSPELIVLSDYAGGVLTDHLLSLLEPVKGRLLVDTKRPRLSCFSGSLAVKLNSIEHSRVLECDPSPERHATYYIVTRGEMGARLSLNHDDHDPRYRFRSITQSMVFRAFESEVVDVCGCGDTFLAGFTAGLIRYGDPCEAVKFANAASATVVSQRRTAVADLGMTLELIGREF